MLHQRLIWLHTKMIHGLTGFHCIKLYEWEGRIGAVSTSWLIMGWEGEHVEPLWLNSPYTKFWGIDERNWIIYVWVCRQWVFMNTQGWGKGLAKAFPSTLHLYSHWKLNSSLMSLHLKVSVSWYNLWKERVSDIKKPMTNTGWFRFTRYLGNKKGTSSIAQNAN